MNAMTTTAVPTSHKFKDAAAWWHALGDVPLERIIMDPAPGTATEEDLLRFVDGDDKRLVELVDGTLVEKPVGLLEALLAANIVHILRDFVLPRRLGLIFSSEATLRMILGNVRLPDVTFISAEHFPAGELPSGAIQTLPPTLAVEVISESNTKAEMRRKLNEYFKSGARLVWLVYPKTKSVAIYDKPSDAPARTVTESESLDGGEVLPGFSVAVAEIFRKTI
jgi:Uma2 family endonuclease